MESTRDYDYYSSFLDKFIKKTKNKNKETSQLHAAIIGVEKKEELIPFGGK